MDLVDQEEERIKKERERLEEELNKERDLLIKEIDQFMKDLETLKDFGSRFNSSEVNQKIEGFNEHLNILLKRREKVNEDELLLGGSETEFPRLLDAQGYLKPFQDLWGLADRFEKYHTSWK